MTYHYKKYEWTAFTEADLLAAGSGNGTSFSHGDVFTMPGTPTVTMSTYDNDGTLSGDGWNGATDYSGQEATINGGRVGSQMYAEQYFVLHGSDGKTYYVIDIEVEGYDAPGDGDSFLTFYGDTPPAGVELTVGHCYNISGHWVDYTCLSAGPSAPPNTPPTFTNLPDDGIFCIDENTTFVIDVDADDADGDAVSFEICGGADADSFVIDATTGELSFKNAPDFENPHDHGHDNTYDVNVMVRDANGAETVKSLWVKVKDVAEGDPECIVIEAEAMNSHNFVTAHSSTASGGAIAKIHPHASSGDLWTKFDGPDGTYDLTIHAQDEDDGCSTIMVKVNGHVVETITLHENDNGGGDDNGVFGEIKIDDLDLKHGDLLQLWAQSDGGEFVRIDKLVLKEAEATGEISGTVFCDIDCDGLSEIDGASVVVVAEENFEGGASGWTDNQTGVSGTDAPADWHIEAEHMHESGFHATHGSNASNGAILKLNSGGGNGDIWCDFGGQDGTYDVKFYFQDENDGQSDIMFKINGELVEAIKLDRDSDGGGSDHGGFSEYVIQDVALKHGDDINLWVDGDNHEWVRFDKIFFENQGTAPEANTYLGDHGYKHGVDTEKTFDLPAGTEKATIMFDFLEIDSWDGEAFKVVINGHYVNLGSFNWSHDEGATSFDAGNGIMVQKAAAVGIDGYGSHHSHDAWNNDNSHSFVIMVDNPGDQLTVGFDSHLNQSADNESWGIDNLKITANVPATQEPVKEGVEIKLIDAAGAVVATTFTDVDGNYKFADVLVGDYQIMGVAPDGTEFTIQDANGNANDDIDSDVDENGMSGTVTVTDGGVVDIDLGLKEDVDPNNASITGRVFVDKDENGLDDDADNDVSGVEVRLDDANGNVLFTATTNADGSFEFTDLPAGDYRIVVEDGPFTVQDVNGNGNDANDSDVDAAGSSAVITLAEGETAALDAGVIRDQGDASISGRLTFDADNDDTEVNTGGAGFDEGLVGRTVELLDANGAVVGTTTTGADGSYTFTDLLAGDYSVRFPDTGDFVFADKGVGAENENSDANPGNGTTDVISVGSGAQVANIDASVQDPSTAAIEGKVFEDNNDNDVNDAGDTPVEGVTVTLLDENGDPTGLSTVTAADGTYSFENLPAGTYSVSFPTVFEGKTLVAQDQGSDDVDSDAGANGQTAPITLEIGDRAENVDAGIEDNGSASIEGKVFMDNNDDSLDNAGDMPVGGVLVVLLNADGTSTGLTTTTGPDGSYAFIGLTAGDYIVQFPTDVDGKVLVDPNAGDDAIDSDAGANGQTGVISVEIGENVMDVDAGVEDPGTASVGDIVFLDENGNGVRDNGEGGVEGVTVELLDETGAVQDTTTTGPDGEYGFDGLDAGVYSVRFTEPADLVFTDEGAAADDAQNDDSDADAATGETDQFELSIGEDEDDIDAGLVDANTASIAGRIFHDDNGNGLDDGEEGAADVTVVLLNADGTPTGLTAVTDASGNYLFEDLPAGDYIVDFPTEVDGKVLVTQDVDGNANDVDDSDADETTGETGVISLDQGENVTDVDAGIEDPKTSAIEGKVFMDNNDDSLEDAGDMPVSGVTVVLLNADGTPTGETTTTGPDGTYAFTGLAAGSYIVAFPTDVEGKTLVDPNAGDDTVDSDALANGQTAPIVVGIDETVEDVDAGVEDPGTASVGDIVFLDENGNGVRDNGEGGVEGVTVELLDETGAVQDTTTTGPDGEYGFDGLDAGVYSVRFTEPADLVFTDEGAAADDAQNDDSDADAATGETDQFELSIGEDEDDIDAGLVDANTASIAGRIFHDDNGNGLDDGEEGAADVTVVLLNADGTPTGLTAVTDASGNYLFEDLPAGDYIVDFPTEVDGKVLVTQDVDGNANDVDDSDADETTGETGVISLDQGENVTDVDAGIEDPKTSAIEGKVFMDNNDDSLEDAGDMPVSGVTVVLLNADGTPTGETTTTGPDGTYAFTGLAAGSYIVAFPTDVEGKTLVDPNAGDDTVDSDALANGQTAPIVVGIDETVEDVSAGVEDPGTASVGDIVFLDENGNGVRDNGEGGVEGVTVELLDETGAVQDTTTTGPDGEYGFDGLDAGVYSVRFTEPADLVFTDEGAAADDAQNDDSDADAATGETDQFELSIGEDEDDIDAGLVDANTASIAGRIFHDDNGNGLDDGEEGAADVTVVLLNADGTPTGLTAVTDASGNYLFEDLPAGDYIVDFPTEVDGKVLVTQDVDGNANDVDDSDADETTGETGVISLDLGENVTDVDAGIEDPKTSAIEGKVFMDNNDDSLEDAGDMPVSGVTVVLLNADGTPTGESTTTGPDGTYAFTGLAAGSYIVAFPTDVEGKTLVDPNAGDDTVDSDALANGQTAPIVVGIDETVEDVSAGVEDPGTASVGDIVFLDENGNGVRDNGEGGVEGVTVELLDETGAVQETTTTGPDGEYSFDGLDAGVYSVRFTEPADLVFTDEGAAADDAQNDDSDADAATGETDQFELSIGEDEDDIDAGLVDANTASIAGRIFHDDNGNGLDDGEEGAADVTVVLLNADGTPTGLTAVTDASGNYLFEDLPAGDYIVDFPTEVDGKVLVTQDVDGNANDVDDSDADETTGETGVISLDLGENVTDVDAGIEDPKTSAIEGKVFMDNNDDSLEDAGDMPVGGVTVALLNADGTPTGETTTTGPDGTYAFTGLAAGSYIVAFPTDVEGKTLVDPNAGDDTVDSDALANGQTAPIVVGIDETVEDVSAGVEDPGTASVGDIVFLDENGNGVRDNGEGGVEGVTVELLDETGAVQDTATTGPDGEYGFDGLDAGVYSVRFTEPADLVFTDEGAAADDAQNDDSDADAATGETDQFELSIGEDEDDIDAGLVDANTAAITGRIFVDSNDDSLDNGEASVPGVTVVLLNADGTPTGLTAETDPNGVYLFENLPAGDYIVDFPTEVDGQPLVEQNVDGNANDVDDSDADETTGETDVISLEIGELEENVDAGFEAADPGTASIGNLVFLDENENGTYDAGEEGVEGVVVTLTGAGEDGIFGTTDDTSAMVTTDDQGEYLFTGLNAGEYKITFDASATGLDFTTEGLFPDELLDNDSDADQVTGETDVISLEEGEIEDDIDAGLVDPNTAAITGRIFVDSDDDSLDNGEASVPGVTVVLLNADGTPTGLTAETDANGVYIFENLPAGDYIVDFPTEVDGQPLVEQDVNGNANDADDSDADETTGETDVISVEVGEVEENVDAGFEAGDPGTAAIGNLVFLDENENGTRDAGEEGVEGVVVTLTGAGEDGIFGTTDDTSAMVTTDDQGEYLFTGLNAGEYKITFDASATGLDFTTEGLFPDELLDNDSDADQVTGETDVISLEEGEIEDDIDAGLVPASKGSIGDTVFLDLNGNGFKDDGEPGVEDVTVTLTGAGEDGIFGTIDDISETVMTDDQGIYSFDDLEAGDYKLTFDASTAGAYVFTTEGGAPDTLLDNDSDADEVTGMTDVFELAAGQNLTTIDAGVVTEGPEATDDEAMTCADEAVTVDVLENDSVGPLTITEVDGQAIEEGDTVVVGGVEVTLMNGELVIDGEAAYEYLDFGEEATQSISYTVSDSLGREATADVDVKFCGVAETLEELHATLPTSGSYQLIVDETAPIDNEAFTIKISGTGDARFDGEVFSKSYCLAIFVPAATAEDFANAPLNGADILNGKDGDVFSSGQISVANGLAAAENLDLINWIINQDFTSQAQFTDWEVQRAIWELTDKYDTVFFDQVDPGYGQDDDVDMIVQMAIDNGEGFMAGPGGIATMIMDPNPATAENSQPFIVGFSFDDNDCLC